MRRPSASIGTGRPQHHHLHQCHRAEQGRPCGTAWSSAAPDFPLPFSASPDDTHFCPATSIIAASRLPSIDREEADRIGDHFRAEGIEHVGIVGKFSTRNPQQEIELKEIVDHGLRPCLPRPPDVRASQFSPADRNNLSQRSDLGPLSVISSRRSFVLSANGGSTSRSTS